tara:strand:- start:59 stop:205 length:147 start_codon:yes stop_codon:yes gene_type:complete
MADNTDSTNVAKESLEKIRKLKAKQEELIGEFDRIAGEDADNSPSSEL